MFSWIRNKWIDRKIHKTLLVVRDSDLPVEEKIKICDNLYTTMWQCRGNCDSIAKLRKLTGMLLIGTNKYAEGVTCLRYARQIFDGLYGFPNIFSVDCMSYEALGYLQTGNLRNAEAFIQEAIAATEHMARTIYLNPQGKVSLGNLYGNLCHIYQAGNLPENALKAARVALGYVEDLDGEMPDVKALREWMGRVIEEIESTQKTKKKKEETNEVSEMPERDPDGSEDNDRGSR